MSGAHKGCMRADRAGHAQRDGAAHVRGVAQAGGGHAARARVFRGGRELFCRALLWRVARQGTGEEAAPAAAEQFRVVAAAEPVVLISI